MGWARFFFQGIGSFKSGVQEALKPPFFWRRKRTLARCETLRAGFRPACTHPGALLWRRWLDHAFTTQIFFFRIVLGQSEGAFGPATLKPDRNLFAIRRMSSGPLCGLRCSCASPRPMRRDGDLIPFSMTIGLLLISTRIVASLALESSSSHLPSVAVLRVGGFGH